MRGRLPRREEIRPDALRTAAARANGFAGTLRLLGLPVTTTWRRHLKDALAAEGVSTAHFIGQGHNRGVVSPRRKHAAEILQRHGPGRAREKTPLLRRALDERGVPHVCVLCGVGDVWQGRRLVLEIDHVNGDRRDNRQENLRYLCPSCHSQTANFAGRGRQRIS